MEDIEEGQSSAEDLWVLGVGLEKGRSEREETVEKEAIETERRRSG